MVARSQQRYTVLAATGNVGRVVVAHLLAQGHHVIAVGRSRRKLSTLPDGIEPRLADFEDKHALARALHDACYVITCAEAFFTQAIIAALPMSTKRLVVMGSTRKFTAFPDAKAHYVKDAESSLRHCPVPWVIVHPTMIYGALGEHNVQRIAAYIKRFRVVPLPNRGKALLQPIYVGDVARCLEMACMSETVCNAAVVVAGPKAITFKELVRSVAAAQGLRVWVPSVPVWLLRLAAWMTRLVPGIPAIGAMEVQRLLEDKAFGVDEMKRVLGVKPVSLKQGLKATFRA